MWQKVLTAIWRERVTKKDIADSTARAHPRDRKSSIWPSQHDLNRDGPANRRKRRQTETNIRLNILLDAKQESSYHAGHEQAPIGKARPNPHHPGRGIVPAFDLAGCGVSINTVTKLLVDAGTVCAAFHDAQRPRVEREARPVRRNLVVLLRQGKNVAAAKAAPDGAGDVWTWTALDADTKLMVSWLVGDAATRHGLAFMEDLKARLTNRIQLTTDGHKAYLAAVERRSAITSITRSWSRSTAPDP